MTSRATDGDRLGAPGFILGLADRLDQDLQRPSDEFPILA